MTGTNRPKSNQVKFFVAGALFISAVIIMIISATQSSADFFVTVQELMTSQEDLTGENLRVSGAVLGDSISYDSATGMLHFTIVNIPADEDEIQAKGGLEAVLHQAVSDPSSMKLDVIYDGPPPDMLRDEAQAIITGTLTADGVFGAEELLLKCPSKYEEALPEQVDGQGG